MNIETEILRRPRFSSTLSLDRIKTALYYFDLDSLPFPWIHIAGSKGKGSVATMLSSILEKSGYKTGLFVSPHVINIRERITINAQSVSLQLFETAYKFIQDKIPSDLFEHLTFFETMTLLACFIFKKEQIDVAVFETGLGGRLDATNAIINPTLSIITPIELEHTHKLGNTIHQISLEKAGIIKPHTPILMSKQKLDAATTIQSVALKKDAKLYSLDQLSCVIESKSITSNGEIFSLNSGITGNTYKDIICHPAGVHQIHNASIAVLATELLDKEGLIISEKSFRSALASLSIPCRYERFKHNQTTFILDGAHTSFSSSCLSETIKKRHPNCKIPVIFSCKHNKDASAILKPLIDIASEFYFTNIPEIHSYPLPELASIAQQLQFKGSIHCFSSEETNTIINSINHPLVLVTGSLILSGFYRSLLIKNKEV